MAEPVSAPTGDFMDHGASADFAPGDRIGPYQLIEMIGEGGMGSVWAAQQFEPVRRLVAVKLIKAGMDTKQVLARFEQERQALAMMDHPNIAKVFDGGMTLAQSGVRVPYFVMELVQGIPITRYCDEHRLSPRERLELFIPVCHAVQHAHQKGIIHRDLKPSNVLVGTVDGRPAPKVIDFGVAKATSQQLTEQSMHTEAGAIVGTPEYMAPEQAEIDNQDIDTRVDVYALGVILYELLAGRPPFSRKELQKAGLLEMLRLVREVDPQRPSTRVSKAEDLPSLAAVRKSEPRRLTKSLRGDLDWIVMKALEKDRTRRYETANGFAMDIQRFLSDEPVLAGPPSRVYRAKKFVSRNRGSVIAAALLLLALIGGVVGTSIGMVRAENARAAEQRQRQIADDARADEERQRLRAQIIADFMKETLRGAAPGIAKGRDSKLLKDLMDGAADRIKAGQLKDDPEAEAELRMTIGNVYTDVGDLIAAEDNLRRAVQLTRDIFGRDDARTLDTEIDLGLCRLIGGGYEEAKIIARRVLDICEARGEAETDRAATAWSLYGQAIYNVTGGATDEPEKAHRRSLEIRRKVNPPGDIRIARSLNLVAFSLRERYENAQAEPLAREAFAIVRARHGSLHPETISFACALADILDMQFKTHESEKLMRATLPDAEAVHGRNHRGVADVLWRLGNAFSKRDDPRGAEPFHVRCLEIRRQAYPGPHKDVASALSSLAFDKLKMGDAAGAEPLFRESMEMRRMVFEGNSPVIAASLQELGDCLTDLGRSVDAIKAYEQSLEIWRANHETGVNYLHALNGLAVVVERTGDYDRSIELYQQVLDGRKNRTESNNSEIAAAMSNLGASLFRKGLKKEAEDMLRQAVELGRQTSGPQSPSSINRLGNLAFMMEDRGDLVGAELLQREMLELQVKTVGRDNVRVAGTLARLGDNLARQSKWSEAEPILREAVTLRLKYESVLWTTANTQSILGGVMVAQKKYADAEPILIASYESLKERRDKIPTDLRTIRLSEAIDRLVRLYEATEKGEEAAKWKAELEKVRQKR